VWLERATWACWSALENTFTFLDDDDVRLPGSLEGQIKLLEAKLSSWIDLRTGYPG